MSFAKTTDGNAVVLRINSSHQKPEPAASMLKIKPGETLPAFALNTTQGHRVTNADLAGHYTLLSFYFADCIPCIAEVPTLNALFRQHKNLEVLAVTYDPSGAAQAFAKQRGFQVPSLVDAQSWIDTLGISTYPTLMLIDPHGHLVATTVSTKLAKHDVPTPDEIMHWVNQHRTM